MSSVNKIFLLGRLGKDPVIRTTGTGKPVCNFSIATSEKRGAEEVTTWFDVVAWEKTAETCQKFLAKGSQVHIEGRVQTREYDAKDGTKRKAWEVVADRVTFVGAKRDGTAEVRTVEAAQGEASPALDEIPF